MVASLPTDYNCMKIATFNINGVNGHLPALLRWLGETAPDVVCLQELKAPEEKFPAAAIRDAGHPLYRLHFRVCHNVGPGS